MTDREHDQNPSPADRAPASPDAGAAERRTRAGHRARDERDRFAGCLLGLAVGDALGAQVEFMARGTFPPVTDMVGGGPHQLPAGAWTDDTSMALCLAESLLECRGFDARDQMNRYLKWLNEGYLSSTGRCFDIGRTTLRALRFYESGGSPFAGSTGGRTAGNGSLMRLAPVAMAYYPDRDKVIEMCGESSRTTHGAAACVDACRLFGGILWKALNGADKESVMVWSDDDPDLALREPRLRAIAEATYRASELGEIRGSGYVVDCLEAAMWCFASTESFEEAVLAAVNLGDDADTTGAVCGMVAGAYWGLSCIPAQWNQYLAQLKLLRKFADDLHASCWED